jgi:hypothetical protein
LDFLIPAHSPGYVDSSRARSPPTCLLQDPTNYELAINLKAAKALGLDVSASVLDRGVRTD